jgi:hypothetical protein
MGDKNETYRTKSGKELTDADVEALSDEAERDHDIEALKRREPGPAEMPPGRIDRH